MRLSCSAGSCQGMRNMLLKEHLAAIYLEDGKYVFE